jgi:hypothetical protein
MKRILLSMILLVLIAISYIQPVQSQNLCVPRMITITIGDNSLGNPAQTFTTELGCIYEVFTDIDGLIPINTPIHFEHLTHFELVDYSSDGYIIGYQMTKLINSTEYLYIITYDHATKFVRLQEKQFKVQAIAE